MSRTDYHVGGFLPEAPAQNRAEEWDIDAGTYSRWDEVGKLLEQRPLTDEERAALAPPTPEPAVSELAEALAAAQLDISKATTVTALRAAMLKLTTALAADLTP